MKKPKRSFNLTIFIILLVLAFLAFTFYYREGKKGLAHQVQTSVSTAFSSLLTPFSWARERFAAVKKEFVTYRALKERNKILEKENRNLKEKITYYYGLANENRRLKELLKLRQKFTFRTVAAEVIGYSPRQDEAVIVIDRGSRSGVKKGLAVIVAEGIVGKVEKVYAFQSLVRLLTDRDSGLSVRIVQTREVGILTADEKGNLGIRFLPVTSRAKPGDDVVTSGFGRLIPEGVFVGKVARSYKKPGSLERVVLISSDVPFDRLEEVLVILD